MPLTLKILTENDLEKVYAFEQELLQLKNLPETQKELFSWSAPWRKESLTHYLPSGWCMGFFEPDTDNLKGYILAQTLLFFRGLTQNLWVEHVGFEAEKYLPEIIDSAHRLARSNHLQSVIFYNYKNYENHLKNLNAIQIFDDTVLIKTTKF